jgi:hypothetical protein
VSPDLAAVFAALAVARRDGDYWAACPRCQPTETDPANYHLHLSPGRRRLVVCYCFKCEDPRGVWVDVVRAHDLPPSATAGMPPATVAAAWEGVAVAGVADPDGLADPDTVHAVYETLLSKLELRNEHRRWLSRRGLDADYAYALGYRSTPERGDGPNGGDEGRGVVPADDGDNGGDGEAGVADVLCRQYGDALAGVPGFVPDGGGYRLCLRRSAVLHPCRDALGRVFALKQRLLDGGKARMRLVSSKFAGGPAAVVGVHCPLGVGGRRWPRVWVTEGERKADVWWHRQEEPVVALPGVGCWRLAAAVVGAVAEAGATVVVALDRDGKEATLSATRATAKSLSAGGYTVQIAEWAGAKGLDDAVVGGVEVRRRPWSGAELVPCKGVNSPLGSQPRWLTDDEVVAAVRSRGRCLRESVPTSPTVVSRLLQQGRLAIVEYTAKGAIVVAMGG